MKDVCTQWFGLGVGDPTVRHLYVKMGRLHIELRGDGMAAASIEGLIRDLRLVQEWFAENSGEAATGVYQLAAQQGREQPPEIDA